MFAKAERIFPNIAVKLLFLNVMVGLIEESMNVLRNDALTGRFKLGSNMNTYLLANCIGVMIGVCYIIGGWLADSYYGKYSVLVGSMITHTLFSYPLLGVAFMDDLFTNFKSHIAAVLIGYVAYGFTKFGYGCMIPLVSEQFSMPQDKQNLTIYYLFQFWLLIFCKMLAKLLLPLIFSTKFCAESSCDAFIFFIGIVVNFLYIMLLFRFKRMFKATHLNHRYVEKCASVMCQATWAQIKRSLTSKESQPKEVWFDLIETEENREVVADTKSALAIFSVLLPCLGYFATVEYLPHVWHIVGYHMNTDFVLFTLQPYQLHGIKYLVELILLPLSYQVFYPVLRKFGLTYSKMVCIGFAFVLLAMCLGITSYFQMNSAINHWQPIEENEALIIIYNTMAVECNIQSEWTNQFMLKPLDMKQIRNLISSEWENNVFIIKCGNNLLLEQKMTEEKERSFSLVIMEAEDNNTIAVKHPVRKVYSYLPRVYVYCGIWPKCPDSMIEMISTTSTMWVQIAEVPEPGFYVTFDLPEVGRYKLNIAGLINKVSRFGSGGLYSFIITQSPKKSESVDLSSFELNPPNPIHIVWFAPQILMISIADILAYVQIQVFIYTQSPTSLRAFIFNVVIGFEVIGEEVLSLCFKKNLLELFPQYHLCIITLACLILYSYANAKYKFRTIYEKEIR